MKKLLHISLGFIFLTSCLPWPWVHAQSSGGGTQYPAVVVADCSVGATVTIGDHVYLAVNTDMKLCADVTVTATIDPSGLATSANQTNGNQKAQVCDAGGDCATVTGSKLDVNATVDPTGLATSANQTNAAQKSQIVDGSGNVIGSANNALNVRGTGTAGTAATGVETVQGIASMTPLLVTLSGTNDLRNITGTISLPTGAATAAKQPNLGTAGSPSTDVVTLQGIASMTPVQVQSNNANVATETTVAKLPVAQGSTTSGQSGTLMQGAVTTAAPTYTTGQTSALSLDPSGSVRVSVVSGSTGNAAAGNTGSAVPTQGDYQGINIGGTLRGQTGQNPSGVIYAADVDGVGTAGTPAGGVLTVQGVGSMTPLLATVTGNITTVSTVTSITNPVTVAGAAADGAAVSGNPVRIAGKDGSGNTQDIITDTTGNQVVVGAGVAGTPAGGVASIQGVSGGTNLPVSQATASALNATVVGLGTAGSAAGGVVTIQGVASMTPLLVTPAANSAINLAQIAGNSTATVATGVLKTGISDGSGNSFLSAANALNSTGTGLQAAQSIAQFDDVSPTAITENQFGNVRMSANRNVYQTIRDAAGNERGANVNASNQLLTAATMQAGTALVGEVNAMATATTTDAGLGCEFANGTGTLASNNSTSCKASAGNFYGVWAVNTTATVVYVRLYNLATTPTCSSSTGFVRSIPVPASTSGAGFSLMFPVPLGMTTGIGFCVTGGGANNDNTNAVAGVFGGLIYK